MQNDILKCGLIEKNQGDYTDSLETDAYLWYDQDWKHDSYSHTHQRYQLTYVEQGYQYFHLANTTYLVPQNHVIWIPSNLEHRISSEAKTVHLRVVMFKTVPTAEFYQQPHVFSAPAVLKEMLLYASKWNQLLEQEEEQTIFLQAILSSLPNFCKENKALHIPVPTNLRLLAICDYINKNYHADFQIEEFATLANLSIRSLQRLFKKETGITLQKYVQLIRILKSIELLDTKQYTLSQIAYKIGYKSLTAFTASYFAIMKVKPKK